MLQKCSAGRSWSARTCCGGQHHSQSPSAAARWLQEEDGQINASKKRAKNAGVLQHCMPERESHLPIGWLTPARVPSTNPRWQAGQGRCQWRLKLEDCKTREVDAHACRCTQANAQMHPHTRKYPHADTYIHMHTHRQTRGRKQGRMTSSTCQWAKTHSCTCELWRHATNTSNHPNMPNCSNNVNLMTHVSNAPRARALQEGGGRGGDARKYAVDDV
jgi:hypothetical protein